MTDPRYYLGIGSPGPTGPMGPPGPVGMDGLMGFRQFSSTTDTLVLGDAGNRVESTGASPATVTIPPHSSVAFPVGTYLEIGQVGTGQVTLIPGVGVTLDGSGASTAGRWSTIGIVQRVLNEWVIGVLPAQVSAKGDLLVADATPALARVAVGADGRVLTADSSQSQGVKWAAAASGDAISNGLVSNFPLQGATEGGSGVTANLLVAFRVLIPTTGHLRDLAVWCSTTASDHLILSVYDTGDATPGSYTKLWDSGSVATPGTISQWSVIADPNLLVSAGQSVMFAYQGDSWATQRYAYASHILTETLRFPYQLPANYIPTPGGAAPKLMWQNAPGSFAAPSSVLESNAVAPTSSDTVIIIGRIS